MKRIYLDHAATTPAHPDVVKAMLPYFSEKFGNPSSIHAFGQETRAAVERARFPVEEKNGSLTVEFKQEDLSIVADESHFSNAIFNLLDNAIKYSQGPPTINLTGRYDKGELKIAIEDKGIGMTKEQQRQVFDKFYRVPTGNLHDVKGFGLGLNYVKYIIEAHHGHIELDSIPGQGSTFAIIIDLSQHAV